MANKARTRPKKKTKPGRRPSFIRIIGFLSRILPAGGISAGAITWGLSYDNWYWIIIGALALTGALKLIVRFSRSTVVAVDIGHHTVKAVQLKRRPIPTLLRYGTAPVPPGTIANGLVQEPDKLAAAIKAALETAEIHERDVVAAVTGQTLVLQHLSFPASREGDLKSTIGDNIDKYVPMPPNEICYDYMRVGRGDDDTVQVLLIATQREPVLKLTAGVREAGLVLKRVGVQPLAAYRAALNVKGLGKKKGRKAPEEPAVPIVQAVVDLGAGTSDVSVFQSGILQLQRLVRVAGDDFTRAIAIASGVPQEEAEQLKMEHGVLPDTPISEAVEPLMHKLFREIWLSLEFVHNKNRDIKLTQVVLLGGTARLKGLADRLQEHLVTSLAGMLDTSEMTVEVGTGAALASNVNKSELAEQFPVLAMGLGLALEEVGRHGGS